MTRENPHQNFDKILDDALESFGSQAKKPSLKHTANPADTSSDKDQVNEITQQMESLFSELGSEKTKNLLGTLNDDMMFGDSESAQEIQDKMKDFFGKFSAKISSSPEKEPPNLKSAIEQTMERLESSSAKVEAEVDTQSSENPEGNSEILEQMMGDLADSEDFQKMIDGMMEELLSKDILMEPLKELSEKYPIWLEKNRKELSRKQYSQYHQQYQYCTQIVELFESSENQVEVNREVTSLMQKMQDCGSPPEEILKQLAPGLEFDENGVPKMDELPSGAGECNLM